MGRTCWVAGSIRVTYTEVKPLHDSSGHHPTNPLLSLLMSRPPTIAPTPPQPIRQPINTCDQLMAAHRAGYRWPYAVQQRREGMRETYFIGWEVYSPVRETDSSERRLMREGCKTFRTFARPEPTTALKKAAALAEAKKWVAEVYGYTGPWKRNHMGAYVPAEVAKLYPLRPRA